MYSSFQLAQKYLKYQFTAFNGKGHGMHSPFVFDFILHVLNNKAGYTPPPSIEKLRKKLLQNKQVLEIEDLGAGSRKSPRQQKTVGRVAATALKPEKYAQLLFRLVKHYQPQTILELGTSLGITTSYLASANPLTQIITIEGSEAIVQKAQENFQELGLSNIRSLTGNFDTILPTVLQRPGDAGGLSTVDLAYIDGNHRYQPTVHYFRQILEKTNSHSMLVFDDIHWSKEMEKAWEEIKVHPAVQTTIDIFYLGFVFFRKEFRVKQHFTIRF
jgi:predicted O-methyltransferase YrrM